MIVVTPDRATLTPRPCARACIDFGRQERLTGHRQVSANTASLGVHLAGAAGSRLLRLRTVQTSKRRDFPPLGSRPLTVPRLMPTLGLPPR